MKMTQIFLAVIATVVTVELLIMAVFHSLDLEETLGEGVSTFLDPLLLGIFSTPLLLYFVIRPITHHFQAQLDEIKKKDTALRKLNTLLEERVKEEVTKRQENEQLLIQQSRMAEMGGMLGAIAHQWKQPVSVLGLLLTEVEQAFQYGELDEEEVKTIVTTGQQQLQFMTSTVDDFKKFFDVSKEKVNFDVFRAFNEAVKLLKYQLSKSDVSLEYEGETENLISYGYAGEFKQVAFNLLNNAREAIEQEKKEKETFLGEERKGKIIVSFSQDEKGVNVRICDNGGGVPKDLQENLFTPYFTTKGASGTGIGLYISKVIVEKNMGGKMKYEDKEGGACFFIHLPPAQEEDDYGFHL